MIGDSSEDELRFIGMCKALGNSNRLKIVEELRRYEPCMCGNIVLKTNLAQSTDSQHLKVWREVGLIQGYDEGPSVCYCLDREGIAWFKQKILEHL